MQNGWDTELSSRISAWRRTLDFSSPQVHLLPKPSAPAEYEKDYSQVERITAPLMGKRSMYSRTLEHGENEFNEELGKNERLAAQDMANEWMKFGGMSLLDFGMLPFPTLMLPYVNFGRLAGFIENDTPGLSIGTQRLCTTPRVCTTYSHIEAPRSPILFILSGRIHLPSRTRRTCLILQTQKVCAG